VAKRGRRVLWSFPFSKQSELGKVVDILLSNGIAPVKPHSLAGKWLRANPPNNKHKDYDILTEEKRLAIQINRLLYTPKPTDRGKGPTVTFVQIHPYWCTYDRDTLEDAIAGFVAELPVKLQIRIGHMEHLLTGHKTRIIQILDVHFNSGE
jgi:hypothetical protein